MLLSSTSYITAASGFASGHPGLKINICPTVLHTVHVCACLVAQSCPILCDPLDCSPPGSSVHGIFQARKEVGSHSLLQGIFPTQRSNFCLLHYRWITYPLSYQGSPTHTCIKTSTVWYSKVHKSTTNCRGCMHVTMYTPDT